MSTAGSSSRDADAATLDEQLAAMHGGRSSESLEAPNTAPMAMVTSLLGSRAGFMPPYTYVDHVRKLRDAHPDRQYTMIHELSAPPSREQLDSLVDMYPSQLPVKYVREPMDRVYVNRELDLEQIKYYGFDMDYTLAIYKSPVYEQLAFDLVVDRLVAIGYPESIRQIKYDPAFAVRGLFVDKKTGHVLKVDAQGVIMMALFGTRRLTRDEIMKAYPSEHISHGLIKSGRFDMLDTLFSLPLVSLLCGLVDHGMLQTMEFADMFLDVRTTVDWVHQVGDLKQRTTDNLAMYVQKDARLPRFLERIRANGSKTFLLTNSDFDYSNKIMSFLLDDYDAGRRDWRDYFDVIIVDARKPAFFERGSPLREVNIQTGGNLLEHVNEFKPRSVYRGGSLEIFDRLVGCKPSQVLFVGDHIFGDIIKTKQGVGWRTFLIVPELQHELEGWAGAQHDFRHLLNLEFIRAESMRNDDMHSEWRDFRELRDARMRTTAAIDGSFKTRFGSAFRGGSRLSFFGMQVERYADLYAPNVFNLLHYPLYYHFTSRTVVMPHEHIAKQ